MSEEESSSVSFQRETQAKKSVIFCIDSDATSSGDRDELMEQYEEKMGELLRCKKEICDLKNENELLKQHSRESEKEFRSSMQEYEKQISELQEKYNTAISLSKQSSISNLSPEISRLTQKCQDLEDALREKESIISRKEAELEEYNESTATMSSEMMECADRFKQQQNEINILRVNMKEMDTLRLRIEEAEKNNKSLMEDNALLQNKMIELQRKFNDKSEESLTMKDEIDEKQIIANNLAEKLKETKNNLQVTEQELLATKKKLKLKLSSIKSLDEDNQKLRVDNKKLSDIANKLKEKIIQLDNKLTNVVKAAPDVDNVDELIEFLLQIPNEQKATRKTLRDMRKENSKLLEKAENSEQLSTENAQLKEHLNKLMKIRLICKSVSNVNHQISSRIRESLGIQEPSLRNVIVMTVMLNRWYKSLHNVEWTNGSLNWWWIAPIGDNKALDDVTNIIKTHNQLIDENEKLENDLNKMKAEQSNKDDDFDKEMSDKYARKLMLRKIEELNEEMSSMVSKEEYEKKARMLYEKKQELKNALETIREMKSKSYKLEEEIGELKLEKSQYEEKRNEIQEKLNEAEEEIEDLNGQIKLMNKYTSSKRKELLSLERGAVRNETEKMRRNVEMQALISENQHLYHKMNHRPARYVHHQDNSKIIRTLL